MPACPKKKQLILRKRQETSAICNPPSLTRLYHTHRVHFSGMIPSGLSGRVPRGPENKQRICRSKTLCFIFNEIQQVMKQNDHAIKEQILRGWRIVFRPQCFNKPHLNWVCCSGTLTALWMGGAIMKG